MSAILLFIFEFVFCSEMKHYSCESAGLASLRPVDSENSSSYFKAILVFHSTASWTITCRQHLLFFTSWTSEGRQSVSKGRGQSCGLDPTLHRELSHFRPRIWNAFNTPPKLQSTLELHHTQEQTTNAKVPWNCSQTALWDKAMFICT